jgi:hypothetical protein
MALAKIEQAIHYSQRTRVDYFQPKLILSTASLPTGVLLQSQGVLEWLHLPHSPSRLIIPYHSVVTKLIIIGHFCTVQLLGLEPCLIVVPFTKEQQAWLQHTDTMWKNALANFTGQLGEHLPSSKLLNFDYQQAFIFPCNI